MFYGVANRTGVFKAVVDKLSQIFNCSIDYILGKEEPK